MEAPKKPGRPAKLDTAMTDKQRAAMYRTRRYEAASTADLLAGLARQLKALACFGTVLGGIKGKAGEQIGEQIDF